MSTGISGKILLGLTVLLTVLCAGCTPTITQEQYNSLKAELKSTQEQLAAKNKELDKLKIQTVPASDQISAPLETWRSMQPYIELNSLLLENQATISQQNSKQITTAYAYMQYADQRKKLAELLPKFNDLEFAETVKSAWDESDSVSAQLKWQYWAKTYITLHDYLETNCGKLTGQLNR